MKKKRIQTIILATCLLLTSGCMSKGKIISTANEIVNNYKLSYKIKSDKS